MNQKVEVGGCQLYGSEVPNQGMIIGDDNIETFTQGSDKEDVQASTQVNEETKTLENNSFNTPHEFSLDMQESDRKQRESNMGNAISIYAE